MRVGVCEGGSGLLGGMEAVRIESWRVERGAPGRETEKPAPGVNSRRDSVERLVSGYNIIGRCGFGVVEVLMWYGREVVGPAPISRELSSIGAGSSLRYEILDGCEWLNGYSPKGFPLSGGLC